MLMIKRKRTRFACIIITKARHPPYNYCKITCPATVVLRVVSVSGRVCTCTPTRLQTNQPSHHRSFCVDNISHLLWVFFEGCFRVLRVKVDSNFVRMEKVLSTCPAALLVYFPTRDAVRLRACCATARAAVAEYPWHDVETVINCGNWSWLANAVRGLLAVFRPSGRPRSAVEAWRRCFPTPEQPVCLPTATTATLCTCEAFIH